MGRETAEDLPDQKLLFPDQALAYPKKLLPLHIIEVFAEFCLQRPPRFQSRVLPLNLFASVPVAKNKVVDEFI